MSACGGDDPVIVVAEPIDLVLVSPSSDQTLYAQIPLVFEVAASIDSDSLDIADIEYTWQFGDGSSASGPLPRVEHTYAGDGEYTVRVAARIIENDETYGAGEVTRNLTLRRTADLAVTQPTLTLPGNTLTADDTIRVSFDLNNLGGEVPDPFDVGIYLIRTSLVDTADLPTAERITELIAAQSIFVLGNETIDGMQDGTTNVNIDRSGIPIPAAAPSDNYHVMIFADTGRVVGEVDRSNNVAVSSRVFSIAGGTSSGPDLIVRDVFARPTRVNRLNILTVDASVVNVGNEPAILTGYAVYLSRGNLTVDEDDRLLGRGDIASIQPNGTFVVPTTTFELDPPVTDLGEYFVLVQADPDETLNEVTRDNNIGASPRIVVTDETVPGVDIVVDEFDILPRVTFVDGSVEIVATIRNQGTEDIDRQFFCRVYLSPDDVLNPNPGGDRPLETIQVQPLAAGESSEHRTLARVPGLFEPGVYYGFIFCNPSFAIPESDVDNNVRMTDGTVSISGEANVDLRIGAFSVTPTTVDNGELVDVSVEVCNDGSNGATPSVLRVHISDDAAFSPNHTVLLESLVPSIEPGACVTIRADVPAVCDTFVGTYNVFAVADATQTVPDVDRSNNRRTLDEPLNIEGLICACEPDRFEPNDQLARAAYLNPNIRLYEDMTMCSSATDWYRVPMLRGETIRVAITFENRRGNLDMTLYGIDRSTELSVSRSNGNREEVSYFVVPQTGDYYIRVQGRTPQDRNVYDLELTVSPRQSGTDLVVLNVRATPDRPIIASTIDLSFDIVNLGDVPAGPNVARFYLSRSPDIDPVRDIRIGELALDGVVDRVSRTVQVTLPFVGEFDGGEAYIGVIADARNEVEELDDTNNIGVSPVITIDADCYDPFEPNNTIDQATMLELNTTPPVTFGDLLVCSQNRDFYEVCVSDGHYLDWSVTFDPANGDVDIKLYDELGAEVARSEGTGSVERVNLPYVTGDRCYRLEVYVVGNNREVPYSMTIDTGVAPDELACSRIEEPNEDFNSARQLRNFLNEDLAICPVTDVDFFRIQLTAGTDITLRLVPAEGETSVPSQLRIALFNPSRNFITNTVSSTEALQHRVALNGTHYIRVRSNGDGPRNQRYRLEITGISGTDLVPLDFMIEPEIAGPGDSVRFSFTAANVLNTDAPASHYAVYLSEDPVLVKDGPNADRLLRELPLPAIPGISEIFEGRRFDVPGDIIDGGTYFVILELDNRGAVEEINDRNNIAIAPIVVTPRCEPDIAEPNNFPFEATPVGDVFGETLTICSGDVDWFTYTTATSGSRTASITFTHSDGDLDLYLYDDPFAPPIGVGDSITDNESITFNAQSGTTYYLRVEGFYNDTNRYTIRVE